jgi:cell division protein FtsL
VSSFNFDPEVLFRRRRPRVVRSPRFTRIRKILLIVLAVIVVLVIVALALMSLRVKFLYLSSLGH